MLMFHVSSMITSLCSPSVNSNTFQEVITCPRSRGARRFLCMSCGLCDEASKVGKGIPRWNSDTQIQEISAWHLFPMGVLTLAY
jgi:uncharacterized protein YfaQ (DUF2300 family)